MSALRACFGSTTSLYAVSARVTRLRRVRIATWNVNSLRSRIDRVEALLQRHEIDVLALQETKAREDQLPLMGLQALGYDAAVAGLNQWNGVALLSRVGLEEVEVGFDGQPSWGEPAGVESRAIGATCGGVRIWSLYVPNGRKIDDPHYFYKLDWLARLKDTAAGWLGQQTALVGDWNIAPQDDDVFDMAAYANDTHVTPSRACGVPGLRRRRLGRRGAATRSGPRGLHLLGLLPAALRAQPRHAHRLRARLAVLRRARHRCVHRPRGAGREGCVRPCPRDRGSRLTPGQRSLSLLASDGNPGSHAGMTTAAETPEDRADDRASDPVPADDRGPGEVGHTHADISGGWLRAATFGAMDGLVTNVSLVAGIGAAGVSPEIVVTAGLAGLVAGAFSMALGEYASVSTQNEAVDKEVVAERREIRDNPRGRAG